ncbi:bifunctional DNA primase/polymerase [Streptomyces kronopolitis]|uniref:bifunctional DNA primase/polymerase n=1 Tax=Streptomyces kronopolitis TaxID=1612435 RepID=UPI00343BF6F6
MEKTIGVPGTPQIPAQRGEQLLETAVRYAQERHWDVFPGAWLEHDGTTPRCSCRARDCAAPGAHPTAPGWTAEATGSAGTVRRLWAGRPGASILLPTGRTFEALVAHGVVQWIRRPGPAHRWLPDAEDLISPLGYACAGEAVAARAR